MPDYIGYSPWQDAANMGAGIGQSLGQAMLALPQQRAQLAMHQQALQAQQQQQLSELALRYGQAIQQQHYQDERNRIEQQRVNQLGGVGAQPKQHWVPVPRLGVMVDTFSGESKPLTGAGTGLGGGLNNFSPVAVINAKQPIVDLGAQHPGWLNPTNTAYPSFFPMYQNATNLIALADNAIKHGLSGIQPVLGGGVTNQPAATTNRFRILQIQ